MKESAAAALLVFSIFFIGCIGAGCGAEAPQSCPKYEQLPEWYIVECANAGGHIVADRDLKTCCWEPSYCADYEGNPLLISNPEPAFPTATPAKSPSPAQSPVEDLCGSNADCVISGCSGEVCARREAITVCTYRPEYACYRFAECACLGGHCAWSETPDFIQCVLNISAPNRCTADSECPRDAVCHEGICRVICGGSDHVPCAEGFECMQASNAKTGVCIPKQTSGG